MKRILFGLAALVTACGGDGESRNDETGSGGAGGSEVDGSGGNAAGGNGSGGENSTGGSGSGGENSSGGASTGGSGSGGENSSGGASTGGSGPMDPCEGVVCQDNASCVAAGDDASCECDTGYQDKDDNGTCEASCDGIDCGNGGTCEDATGTTVCNCPATFQDEDRNLTCESDCTGTDCGSNGTCSTASGTATCECAPGWAGAVCDVCAIGFTGPLCDTCDVGFNGSACDQCDPGLFGPTCDACPVCVGGTCNEGANGDGMCLCDANFTGDLCDACVTGYTGAACDQCDVGYQDVDGDGVCEVECGGGSCVGLDAAHDLASGTHTFTLLTGDTPVYVDGDYDEGSWVLIGRGREGWAWSETGMGNYANLGDLLGTSDAFSPAYLPTAVIQRLVDETAGGTIDMRDVEVRAKRATSVFGDAFQEVSWTNTTRVDWTWLFDSSAHQVTMSIADSAFGSGFDAITDDIRDHRAGGNDQRRLFTFAWSRHENEQGFSYGNGVNDGSSHPQNFLWEDSNEGHAIPYTEVYARVADCALISCQNGGTCSDDTGVGICSCPTEYAGDFCETCSVGFQDNDDDGVCTESCATVSCSAGEACLDLSGTAECRAIDGIDCLDILTNDSTADSGFYLIDPDGAGGGDPFGVYCDMVTNGGGWTRVSIEDFEDSAEGWDFAGRDTTSTCAAVYGPMLGGFGVLSNNADPSKTFDLSSIPHTEVRATLDYIVMDSWDGEFARVSLDGSVLYDETFSHGGPNVCGSGWGERGAQPVDISLAHTASSVTLQISSGLNQGATDESYGARDVAVYVR